MRAAGDPTRRIIEGQLGMWYTASYECQTNRCSRFRCGLVMELPEGLRHTFLAGMFSQRRSLDMEPARRTHLYTARQVNYCFQRELVTRGVQRLLHSKC